MATVTEKSLVDEFRAGQKLYNKIENASLASSDPSYQVFIVISHVIYLVLKVTLICLYVLILSKMLKMQ